MSELDGDWIFLGAVAALLVVGALVARLRGQDFFKRDDPMRPDRGMGGDTSSVDADADAD